MKELKRLFKHFYPLDVYRILRDKVITKMLFPSQVKLIRQPAYIVGKKFILFGKNFSSGVQLRIEVIDKTFVKYPIVVYDGVPKLIVGDNVTLNFNVHIGVMKKIVIGDNVLIGSNVLIIDHNHGNYKGKTQDSPLLAPKERKCNPKEVIIGNNVWIADNVSILPGTIVGEGCIVGANTVLNGIYDKNQVLIGTPARVVKKFCNESEKWESVTNKI